MPSGSGNSKLDQNFSQELADALSEGVQQPTKLEQIEHAYNSLCFDDPRVDSDEACRLLAKALKDPSSSHHLSERLVDGVRQATARTKLDVQPKKTTDESASQEEASSTTRELRTAGGATPLGYSLLSFTIFCEIPLQCCEATSLKDVQILLGSFRGPERDDGEVEVEKEVVDEDIDVEARIQAMQQQQTHASGDRETQYEEVWAEESDPSDFVFESNAQQVDWSAWEDVVIDPIKLSKPLNDGWHQVTQAVGNLLRELNLSMLQPIPSSEWRLYKVSGSLTQLTLTIALESRNSMLKSLRRWSVQPLNVLRDRFLSKHDCAGDYLTLVQSLIAVNAGKNDNPEIFEESSLMGLASLSYACQQMKQYGQLVKIRLCSVECCENLATLVSQFSSPTTDASTRHPNEWVGLVNAILPLLEVISNVSMNGTHRMKHVTLSPKEAQWLLNSDLLRELVMFSSKRYSSSLPAFAKLCHQALVGSVLSLSLQNMQIIGKYVYRVPEMAMLFSRKEFLDSNVVESILWSMLGSQFAGTGVLRRKDVTPMTVESSKKQAIEYFNILCVQVVESLHELGRLRSVVRIEDLTWKGPILDLSRFANLLNSCRSLSALWKETLSTDVLQSSLGLVKSGLSTLPSADRIEAAANKRTDDEYDDKKELKKKTVMKNQLIEEEALVRTSVKILSMSLEEQGPSPGSSSKTD